MRNTNWYKIIASLATGGYIGILKKNDGSDLDYSEKVVSYIYAPTFTINTNVGSSAVYLGNDNSPASVDDYWLKGELVTSINSNYVENRVNNSNEVIYTITNTGSEAITISEMVLSVRYYTQDTSGSQNIIVDRTVLDAPLVIQPGSVGQLTYTLSATLPEATATGVNITE